MQKKKNECAGNYSHDMFLTFLRSYMAIMLIPLLVSVVAYVNMYNTALSSERERLEYSASQCGMVMDAEISEIRSMMNQTLIGSQMTRLLTSDGVEQNPSLITDAMQFKNQMTSFTRGTLLDDYLVYFQRPNLLFCTSGGVYYNPYQYTGDLRTTDAETIEEDKWYSLLNSTSGSNYSLLCRLGDNDGSSETLLLYMRPVLYEGRTRGSMTALIKQNALIRMVRKAAGVLESDTFWVESTDGQVLLSSPGDPDASNVEMVTSSFSSDATALTYYVAQPKALALSNVYRSVGYMLVILVAAVVLGVMMAIALARRQGVPLDNIKHNLNELYANKEAHKHTFGGARNINYIDESIKRLIDSHNAISDYMSRQTGLVERMFFEKLYAGMFDSEQDITEMLTHLHREQMQGAKRLIVIRMEHEDGVGGIAEPALDDAGLFSRAIDGAAANIAADRYHRYEPDMNTCTILLGVDGDADGAQKFARDMLGGFDGGGRMRLHVAISGEFDEYTRVWRLYQDCLYALQHDGADIISVNGRPQRAVLDYTVESETRLMNLVLAGKTERVAEVMGEIASQNADAQPEKLKYALGTTFTRLGAQLAESSPETAAMLEGALDGLDEHADVNELCAAAGDILRQVSGKLGTRRGPRGSKKMDGVIEFINENYANPDMSLSMLADRFSLTETYLSHAYKEYTGMNISGYIEKLRISRAQELLREGKTLEQIAQEVGYGHVYSFRTAFKRVTGLTPGAYRDNMQA